MPAPIAADAGGKPSKLWTRDQRLRCRQDFLRVQASSARVTTEHFVFLMAPMGSMASNASGVSTRIGITVTKKVGCAVVRNRAKRLLREAFRHMAERLPSNVDMVVIVRKPLHRLTTPDVCAEWASVEHLVHRRARFRRTE